jgi:hypothetical protein
VSALASRLHGVAVLAERAAAAGQFAELTGPPADPALIGALQEVADALYQHPRFMDPPLGFAKELVQYLLTLVYVLFCVAVLLAAPNPAQPWVLAATMAGCLMVTQFLTVLIAKVWDRYSVRALAAAGEPETVEHLVCLVRSRLAAITATLETDRNDNHLAIGRQIDYALRWLDAAEQAATERPG